MSGTSIIAKISMSLTRRMYGSFFGLTRSFSTTPVSLTEVPLVGGELEIRLFNRLGAERAR